MSRIRSIHPGFFKDERLVATSMAARMLFIGLGVEADDKGIFEWKPITIKMNVFPGDNLDVAALLSELEAVDAIQQYEIDGRKYGAIRNFRKFQRPKTPNNVHPISSEISKYVGLSAPNSETPTDDEAAFPPKGEKSFQMEDGGGRMEEKQKPTVSSKKASRWEIGQKVPAEWLEHTKAKFPKVEAFRFQSQTRQFEDYWPGQEGRNAAKADWETAFVMWIRKAFPEFEADSSAASPELVVLPPTHPDFLAVQKLRGKPILVGDSGSATITRSEVLQARAHFNAGAPA